MNRLNRLFRGNENSQNSQRNFNNNRTYSPQFENPNEINLGQSSHNHNFSPSISNNEIENYPSPLHQHNYMNNFINNNNNNDNYSSDSASISLDPSGCINELCIANITNSCKFGKRCRFIHGKPCSLCNENVYNPLKDLSDQMIGKTIIYLKLYYYYLLIYL